MPAIRSRSCSNGDGATSSSSVGTASTFEQLRERIAGIVARNGHAAPHAYEADDDEPPALRATRSAAAARARAGATVAARRSPAEVWALRGLAALVVLVLLITFLLLIASLA